MLGGGFKVDNVGGDVGVWDDVGGWRRGGVGMCDRDAGLWRPVGW